MNLLQKHPFILLTFPTNLKQSLFLRFSFLIFFSIGFSGTKGNSTILLHTNSMKSLSSLSAYPRLPTGLFLFTSDKLCDQKRSSILGLKYSGVIPLKKRELHGFGVNSPTPFVSYQGSFNRSKSAVKWLFWD